MEYVRKSSVSSHTYNFLEERPYMANTSIFFLTKHLFVDGESIYYLIQHFIKMANTSKLRGIGQYVNKMTHLQGMEGSQEAMVYSHH